MGDSEAGAGGSGCPNWQPGGCLTAQSPRSPTNTCNGGGLARRRGAPFGAPPAGYQLRNALRARARCRIGGRTGGAEPGPCAGRRSAPSSMWFATEHPRGVDWRQDPKAVLANALQTESAFQNWQPGGSCPPNSPTRCSPTTTCHGGGLARRAGRPVRWSPTRSPVLKCAQCVLLSRWSD